MKQSKFPSLITIGKLFIFLELFFSTEISLAQKNNIKATAYTGLKFSFAFERSITPTSSIVLGYKESQTDYVHGRIPLLRENNGDYNYGHRLMIAYRKYFYGNTNRLAGAYFAPITSFGMHEVTYSETFQDGAKYGGKEEVNALGLGVDLGVLFRRKVMNFEMGVNFSKNFVFGDVQEVRYADSRFEKFKSDLIGFSFEYYFGVGFAF